MPGRIRLHASKIGPASFNRFGQATDGKHCVELATAMKKEGFADFKYKFVGVHKPNPKDPFAVARHAHAMSMNDEFLPRYAPNEALYGSRIISIMMEARSMTIYITEY